MSGGSGRPVGPGRGAGGLEPAAWIVPGAALLFAVALTAVWAGGGVATAVAGHGWHTAPFRPVTLVHAVRLGPRAVWPAADPAVVITAAAVLGLAVLVPLVVLVGRALARRPAADSPHRSLATGRELRPLLLGPAARRAAALRPSLQTRFAARRSGLDLPALVRAPGEVGLCLGGLATRPKTALFASWEDVAVAVMAPRSGKTTALAIPAVLAAPGAVLATSNKADLLAATGALRAGRTGEPVWVFDPQSIAPAAATAQLTLPPGGAKPAASDGGRQWWWWNPLAGVVDVEEAARLAGHFVQEVRGGGTLGTTGGQDFWASAASDLLTSLLLAAGSSGRSLVEVYEWLNDPLDRTPVELLRAGGHTAAAAALQGRMRGASDTREGIYETARTAAQCLRNPAILAWVTPPAPTAAGGAAGRLPEFDAAAFPLSRQTLYLLSKDGAGAAAPLVAALADRVMREAVRAAERAPGGRLDPPLLAVLDEAANICKIGDLPLLYSHLGSRGVLPLTVLQSAEQAVTVWGEHGWGALWSAATIKLVGAGVDDPRFAEDVSRLVGDHDVTTVSYNSGGGGPSSRSTSVRRQRILPPESIRALPKGMALLLATGVRPAMVRTRPWYESADAAAISAAIAAASGAEPGTSAPNAAAGLLDLTAAPTAPAAPDAARVPPPPAGPPPTAQDPADTQLSAGVG